MGLQNENEVGGDRICAGTRARLSLDRLGEVRDLCMGRLQDLALALGSSAPVDEEVPLRWFCRPLHAPVRSAEKAEVVVHGAVNPR
jgi:hypothetical protein